MNTIPRIAILLTTLFLLLIPTVHAAASKSEYNNKVAILMYHHMTDGVNKPNTDIMTTKQFDDQLSYLQRKGFHFISLRQYIDFMKGGTVPSNAVLVTFDDGYESYSSLAYPILKSKNIPSVAFIITSATDNKKYGYIPHMTHEELKQVTADNLAEVQCHTNNLHYLVDKRHNGLTAYLKVNGIKETQEQYQKRVQGDVTACKNQLMPINASPIDTFAYPYGIHDRKSEEVLRQANIQFAFTVKEGISTQKTNRLAIPRINGGSPSITPADLEAIIIRNAHPYSMDAILHRANHLARQAPHRKSFWALCFLLLIGIGYMGYRQIRKSGNPFAA
ncbi:hypothetical protein PCCS19_22330 [Paenibacillus sp. CCS19]|uniref:polysaccharide deacetylase family protein n=1 Tax=Paenibacillus sp. CCS19 TaxID=3158387 RepID=UPI00255F8D7E|nr:polysaccharide deacetylase family protein [Paenibacillus cellulosilyticus]GMK39179.1 hypothetical protein PCCS19_22330 [Paenibacillus cellulosilyticus]